MNILFYLWNCFKKGNADLHLVVGAIQFIIVVYALFVERFDLLLNVFSNVFLFGAVFGIFYFVASVLMGMWIYKKGLLENEQELNTKANPFILDSAEFNVYLMDIMDQMCKDKEFVDLIPKIKRAKEVMMKWKK